MMNRVGRIRDLEDTPMPSIYSVQWSLDQGERILPGRERGWQEPDGVQETGFRERAQGHPWGGLVANALGREHLEGPLVVPGFTEGCLFHRSKSESLEAGSSVKQEIMCIQLKHRGSKCPLGHFLT